MCDTCGCNLVHGVQRPVATGGISQKTVQDNETVSVLKNLLSENDRVAVHNRQHFDHHRVLVLNLMSSPGSGKTSLLEATIDALGKRYRIAVIEGDLETENDAERIRKHGVQALQITTGTACHLDANMLHGVLPRLNLADLDILFIENVGNLVCPAGFDLGQHRNITLLSVTEGDDKPSKYPVMFRVADLVLLTKTDLLPVLDDFVTDRATANVRALANAAPVLEMSAKQPGTLTPWLKWLDQEVRNRRT